VIAFEQDLTTAASTHQAMPKILETSRVVAGPREHHYGHQQERRLEQALSKGGTTMKDGKQF
jgi:hypothetical protein